MLSTIALFLIALWLLGVTGVYSVGWAVNVLLLAAVVALTLRAFEGAARMS